MDDFQGKSVMDHDFADYAIEASYCTLQGNRIIIYPSYSVLNFFLLEIARRNVCSTQSPMLMIASSELAVNQIILYLKRHLLTSSIGSSRSENNEDTWPMITVIQTASIANLLENRATDFSSIIILDCQDAMQDDHIIQLINHVNEMEKESQPVLHCFTSCLLSVPFKSETVQEEINAMELFYSCKLLSICDQYILERIFPSPPIIIKGYKRLGNLNNSCREAVQILENAQKLCLNYDCQFNSRFDEVFKSRSETFLTDTLQEIKDQMEELGQYGGYTAALAAFHKLVRLYTYADNSACKVTKYVLSFLVCSLSRFRKILDDDMFRVQLSERVERFSSEKVHLIMNNLEKLSKSQRAIIIVNSCHSASVLTSVLQKIVQTGKKNSHLHPKLMISGSAIPFSESWEDILSWERNMEVYSSFIAGKTNLLVLSGDLQGLDLPSCDVVIAFDKIEKYSLFLKAKSFVKSGTGKLVLLTEESSFISYSKTLQKFEAIGSEIKKILLDEGDVASSREINGTFTTPLGAEVGPENAINIINRYCESLKHDKFSFNGPVWQVKKYSEDTSLYEASICFSRFSPVNKIKSEKMTSWKAAQQDAALKACLQLHTMKELNDIMDAEPSLELEKKFRSLQLDSSSLGETKLVQEEDVLSKIAYPSELFGAQPKPGMETYVHTLKMWPVSEPPSFGDNRKTALYELLCSKCYFAILSCKPLVKVCPFPIFMFGHELTVEVETSNVTITLNLEDLFRLRRFHCGLFMNVLPIVQRFMQFDIFNKQNSYLIAPLTTGGEIDWNVVDNNFFVPECRELTLEEKANLTCTPETHEKTMVKPWYRHLISDQVYLVSKVCTDMDADSCFPTDDFDSFKDYFCEKYSIILERPELPLLEVYLLNTKFNALMPRKRSHKMRREEKLEEFREHMVPELCMPLLFPAALWLNLSGLPSVLHRLGRLLLAEELRQIILRETGVGASQCDMTRLPVDLSFMKDGICVSQVPAPMVKRGLAIGNVKLEDRKKLARLKKPWELTQEPVDVHRHLESLNFVEIRYLDEFLIKSKSCHSVSHSQNSPVSPDSDPLLGNSSSPLEEHSIDEPEEYSLTSEKKASRSEENVLQPISLLKPFIENQGPNQYDILEVLTSSSSNDTMNMDRIEILGNSFLKLAVSVFAYECTSDSMNSNRYSILDQLSKSLLSESNLVQCAIKSSLCSRLKVLDFSPGEWIPPSFTTPLMLKEVLTDQNISPNALQYIHLTEVEQLRGVIEPNSEDDILDVLTNFVDRGTSRREEGYIDRLYVPFQTAARCVQALIGTYFKNSGWQGALKVIGWLQLLPLDKAEVLLDYTAAGATTHTDISIECLPFSLDSLEQSLKYNFNNKLLLVQAVTHSSYVNDGFKGCMDCLAFLGGGILDFLLTCYAYENFVDLSPSKIWRLREILSCTSTLAYLSVRHNFHKYLLSSSLSLLDSVDRFVNMQSGCQQPINDEVQLLFEEHECETSLEVEVPQVLSLILTSLVGAVYLDCGKNLKVVWETFSKIFIPELDMWHEDVPLSVVELLKELSPAAHQVVFSSKELEPGKVEVTCKVLIDNTREAIFVARGSDQAKVKTHAAKLALRNLLGSFTY